MPVESFRSSQPAQPVAAVSDSLVVENDDWTRLVGEKPAPESQKPDAYASAALVPPAHPVSQRVRQATERVNSSVGGTESGFIAQQPRPKPGQKKTLREILGLKPRKKLNWWQRIPWQLKASIPVIGVAIVFAILNISVLAIIFGLLGAFLLIRGLKRSFRVRRPLF
ncbi:hypothetical protein GCM10027299_43510 [Larkinella ripae]